MATRSAAQIHLVNGEVDSRRPDRDIFRAVAGTAWRPVDAKRRSPRNDGGQAGGTIAAEIPLALAGARDKKWLEVDPGNVWIKVLWTNADSGAWAVLYRWSKGYVAPPHRHLSDAHMLVLSGALKVRDGCFGPGDYGYEPKGAVHGSTTTLEDCVYLFICNGRS
jgi:anti-sigma factor ChrR (cupin superfamily)